MESHQLINQDSGKTEYYTDAKFIESARLVMDGIDLDPASSETANRTVRATRFFTAVDDGLAQVWSGRVWMNHPFSRETNPKWVRKLIESFEAGTVTDALCICYAATSERWFKPLIAFPQCFLSPRTNYFMPDGSNKKGVTKGSVITYLGSNFAAFKREFASHGTIKIVG